MRTVLRAKRRDFSLVISLEKTFKVFGKNSWSYNRTLSKHDVYFHVLFPLMD